MTQTIERPSDDATPPAGLPRAGAGETREFRPGTAAAGGGPGSGAPGAGPAQGGRPAWQGPAPGGPVPGGPVPGALPGSVPGAAPGRVPGGPAGSPAGSWQAPTPPPWQGQQQWAPPGWSPQYPGQLPPGAPAWTGGPVQAPPVPAPRSPLSGARLLAWTGGAVTLIGVVLLFVLASSRDWFGPSWRVGSGALLGAALIGLATWLHRKESARIGAVALAATGFAAIYLAIAAAVGLYELLPAVPALVIALVVAGCGLGLADWWRSQVLGCGAVIAAVVLAPVLARDWLLVALALALQLAALPVVLRRTWPALMVLAAAGPLLFGAVVGAMHVGSDGGPTIAVALAALLVGLATVVAARELPPWAVAAVGGSAAVPALATGTALGGWAGGSVIAAAGIALTAVALAARFAPLPQLDFSVRVVLSTAAALTLFQATQVALTGATATTVILGQGLVAAAGAAYLRSKILLVVAMVFGTFGALAAMADNAPLASLTRLSLPVPPIAVGVAAMVLVTAVAVLFASERVGWVRPDARTAPIWVPIGLIGLYGATAMVVIAALLIAPNRTGFTVGHALVTISWTVAALVLLARGITRPALRISGLVLVGAAVAKLVLFDLTALDGLARVAAFIGAGLVLLAAGARYARMIAEAEAKVGG